MEGHYVMIGENVLAENESGLIDKVALEYGLLPVTDNRGCLDGFRRESDPEGFKRYDFHPVTEDTGFHPDQGSYDIGSVLFDTGLETFEGGVVCPGMRIERNQVLDMGPLGIIQEETLKDLPAAKMFTRPYLDCFTRPSLDDTY